MKEDDRAGVSVIHGDEKWHDGAGWYYVVDEYLDEGSCGAFKTKHEAVDHARAAGYRVERVIPLSIVQLIGVSTKPDAST